MAHTCNPTYLGGRNQEDLGKNLSQKRAGIGSEFKPQYQKKKKKKIK
jgi:hypothetical protein